MTPAEAVLLEQMQSEARIVEEATPCLHERLTIYKHVSGAPLNDHDTSWGCCIDCAEWIVQTSYANGRSEDRTMTAGEREAWEQETIKQRYAAFLEDFHSGMGI